MANPIRPSNASRIPRETALIAALASKLEQANGTTRGEPGSWKILRGVRVQFGDDVIQPALAAWPAAALPGSDGDGPMTIRPTWVCEILSRRTQRAVRVTNQAIYCREKVEFLWCLDPELHTLETLRWIDGRMTELDAYSDDDRVRAVPFDTYDLDLAALWAELEQ